MAPLYPAIQKSIITAISQPQFSAALPPLSDAAWAKLLAPYDRSHDENERLEFLGDALMYATIGRMLYAQIPDGTPNLYTNVRAALHSNATFSHLAEKLDILAVSSSVLRALTIRNFGEAAAAPILKTKPEIKATADLFETVIGAYYLERGFEALCEWVKEIYRPLIIVAQKTYIEWYEFCSVFNALSSATTGIVQGRSAIDMTRIQNISYTGLTRNREYWSAMRYAR
ncbi:hypothetical protein IEO21_00095 [Rhodonia placenta]|uniref:RNase III domain-containing protein n=1 Tax=Rhodonia placenta TaxID=104341 RepID=A0A8H7PC56_9APHY|nr:hypothetical protein IEO21_00095 [Postia placenta]